MRMPPLRNMSHLRSLNISFPNKVTRPGLWKLIFIWNKKNPSTQNSIWGKWGILASTFFLIRNQEVSYFSSLRTQLVVTNSSTGATANKKPKVMEAIKEEKSDLTASGLQNTRITEAPHNTPKQGNVYLENGNIKVKLVFYSLKYIPVELGYASTPMRHFKWSTYLKQIQNINKIRGEDQAQASVSVRRTSPGLAKVLTRIKQSSMSLSWGSFYCVLSSQNFYSSWKFGIGGSWETVFRPNWDSQRVYCHFRGCDRLHWSLDTNSANFSTFSLQPSLTPCLSSPNTQRVTHIACWCSLPVMSLLPDFSQTSKLSAAQYMTQPASVASVISQHQQVLWNQV